MRSTAARICLFLTILGVALAITSSREDTLIVDEIPHIGAGYSYAAAWDFRLNPEHPPLAKTLAGLAILPFTDGSTAFTSTHWRETVNGQWNFGRTLIYKSGNNADTITFAARLPMLLFLVLTVWVLYRWAAERYSERAALFASILLIFSPTVLAHARFVTTDMAAAWGVVFATYFFIRYLKEPKEKRRFIIAAGAFGLALLGKFSTFLLVPYFFLLAALWALAERHARRKGLLRPLAVWVGRTGAVMAAGFIFVVWPVYLVHTLGYPPARQLFDTEQILQGHPVKPGVAVITWMADKPVIRAAGHYGLGLMMVAQRSVGGNTIYWMGDVVKAAGPWYFPTVYFLKEPIAFWVLASLAFASLLVHARRRHEHKHKPRKGEWLVDHFDELAMLLWLVIYWGSSVTSTLNIGVRHLLPVYPFTILLIAGRLDTIIDWLHRYDTARLKFASGLLAILLGWYVFEGVSTYPHFLTYFNQFAGGPDGGYRYVVDSNLDWGQDLRRLRQYMDQNGVERVDLDYFGWADQGYYLPGRFDWGTAGKYTDTADFVARNRTDGWIAVSATFLQNSNGFKTFDPSDRRNYHWLTLHEPAAVIGNSIFLWHITE